MEIPTSTVGLAQLATSLSQNKLEEAVDVAVLKKAIDAQEQSAAQLLEGLSTSSPPSTNGAGGKIDVTA